jgi:hypothetical protein
MKENDTIHIIGYPEDNISKHPSIKNLLWIYPTLWLEIDRILRNKKIYKNKSFSIWDYPKNSNFDLKNFKNDKKSLLEALDKLSEILWDKKPIVFLSDWCFTNDLFTRELWELLEDDYTKYVEEVEVSYIDETKNNHIPKYLYNNSILILWWSFTNLEDVPQNLYKSELVNFIVNVHKNKVNSKLIWICWWHQFISHIIWLDEIISEKITTTYIWEAQFWVMPSKLVTNINNVPFAYRGPLNAITNNWKNKIVSASLTRTWHVDLNFLKSYRLQTQSLIPLLIDPITKSSRICWSKNSQYFWVQDHYEVKSKDTDILYENINNLLKELINTYWNNIKKILSNIEKQSKFNNELWEPLYASILLSFSNSIIAKEKHYKNNINEKDADIWKCISDKKLKSIISKENFWDETIPNSNFLKKLDEKGILKLVTYLDWSISRWSEDFSNILWFDLLKLIKIHKTFLNDYKINTWNYIFRDLWAGRWKLIDDIENKIGLSVEDNESMVTYWVSDYAYFNIYEWLISLNEFKDIPKNVFKIFVEELIIYYKKINIWSEEEKITKSLESIKLKTKYFKVCSMFSEWKTYRFNDQKEKLTREDKKFIKYNKNRINDLKEYIKENFYDLIMWIYDKIIFSDFNSLYINDKNIKTVDFQTAIRATCHIDENNISELAQDHVDHYANIWSIFVDNWIIRSDSWVPRIKEFIDLEKNNKEIKVSFIYDTKTSYVTSAIVNRVFYLPEEKIKSCLDDWYIMLSTDEIDKCSFLKIERFFRELMIFTFKNLQFSHDKNKEIVNFLKNLSANMNILTPEQIKELIILKINSLIINVNKEYNKKYTVMDWEIFDKYLENVNNDIIDFFKWWKIIIPEWFNQAFERNN